MTVIHFKFRFFFSRSTSRVFRVKKKTISEYKLVSFHPKKDGKLAVFVIVNNDVTVVGKTFVLVTVRNLVENAL